jgi:NIMA (never in mitosis gene a)-related kinase
LAAIEHPYVVSYKEAFYDNQTELLNVVMEFANEGDLDGKNKKHLKHGSRFPEKEVWKVAYQCLEGLSKLHDLNIIHRDIKAANIFFHNGDAKIGDLNVAKHLKDAFTVTQTGTPYYASPEVWNEEPYNYKSDIWSLGCVLYEMCMLKPPFRAENA